MSAVVDLFAGPGGWDVGARELGLDPIGVEKDAAACATRAAAGLRTVRGDVEHPPLNLHRVELEGLIASPPCTDFSVAGKRAGRNGETGRLIDLVPLWVERTRPRWVACEQVPPCEAIWHEHAQRYERLGYRTWVGVLNAADYGVPQTRRRAFLLASLDVQPVPPVPTHAKDSGGLMPLERWVSMAEALGWGLPHRPCWTLSSGAEPIANAKNCAKLKCWAWKRPATSVCADPRVPEPGYRGGRRDYELDPDYAVRSGDAAIRITLRDALILQSFPADYPVQGSKTKQFEQVGNAVPPRLAKHVLAAISARISPRHERGTTQ